MNENNLSLICPKCGAEKKYKSYDVYYEMRRAGKLHCQSCAKKIAWDKRGRISKYDAQIKKGNKYGLLIVISDKIEKCCQVQCQCQCGRILKCKAKNLLGGKSLGCRACLVGRMSSHWKGIGEVPMMAFINVRDRAESRKIPFYITLEYISKLFDFQHGKCALSGLELKFYARNKVEQTASLDRIDSSKGYEEGNVQWVHKHINSMKNSYTTEYFIKLCDTISKYNRRK